MAYTENKRAAEILDKELITVKTFYMLTDFIYNKRTKASTPCRSVSFN